MNNYLLQLLKEIKTIIIPGLGALTLTNEATGEMMFMNYLKFDDGTLAKHIAEKEGIEVNDANNRIAKFVREVQAEADKGGTYDMYQFGSFRKEDGEIIFEQWSAGTGEQKEIEEPKAPEEAPVTVSGAVENVPPVLPETKEPDTTEQEISPREESEEATAAEIPVIEFIQDETEDASKTESRAEELAAISDALAEPEKEETVELTDQGFDTEHAAPVTEEKPVIVHETPLPVNDIPEEVKHDAGVPPSPKDIVIAEDKKAKNKDNSPLTKAQAEVKPEKNPAKKRSAISYILWGIVVLLLGAATYVAVNFNSLKKSYPVLADLTGSSEKQEEDTLVEKMKQTIAANKQEEEPIEAVDTEETEAAPETVPEPISEPAPPPALKPVTAPRPVPKPAAAPRPVPASRPVAAKPRTPKTQDLSSVTIEKPNPATPYHVIGGSFASETNAKKFALNMIRKGNKSVIVGEFQGMYRVSLSSFATKDEAVSALGYLTSLVPSAWVFKWP